MNIAEKIKVTHLWCIFEIMLVVLVCGGSIPILLLTSAYWYLFSIFSVVLLVNLFTLYSGFTIIPHNNELIVELLGRYVNKLYMPGPHLFFPWFGLMRLKHLVFKGEIMLDLYTEDMNGQNMLNKVDFKDASARVIAVAYIKITDSVKATYNIQGAQVLRGVREKLDGALRSYLGGMEIQTANEQRVNIDKERVFHGIPLDCENINNFYEKRKKTRGDDSTLEIEISKWGVNIISLAVADIMIDEEDEKVRRTLLQAVNVAKATIEKAKGDAAAAKKDAEKILTLANANADALRISAIALANELEVISKTGELDPEIAATHVQRLRFYSSLEKTGSNIIMSESGSHPGNIASAGAAFGAGMSQTSNKKNEDKENQQ